MNFFPSGLRFSFYVVMLAATLSCSAQSTDTGSTSGIANGDFEAGSDVPPQGWNLDPQVNNKGDVDLVSTNGNTHLRLSPNERNGGNELLGLGQLLDASALQGEEFQVSALLGAEGNSNAVVGVHALGPDGDSNAQVQLRQSTSEGELRSHEASLRIPRNTTNLVVYAVVEGQSGSAQFDNLTISTAPSEISTENDNFNNVGASAPSRIVVALNSEVRRIPASIFGTNIEWILDGQGIWSDEYNGLHPEAVRFTREMNTTLLRFPGGVFSDYYHWRDGVGPQSARPIRQHYPNGPESRNVFGTDEALELAEQSNASLLITVNAGTGTADEAAEWVGYVNQERGANVEYWEIGNELYMEGDLSGTDINASEYADRVVRFARAMRAVDPDIKLGAIGGINYGRYNFVKSANWSNVVLDRTASVIDFFAVHNAYAPVLIGAQQLDPTRVYQALLAAPVNISSNLDELDQLLSRYENDGRRIELAITEWGPFFHVEPGSPWVDHVKTLGSSLFVGSALQTFLRHPRVEVANAFKLTDFGFMGWIGRDGDQFRPTAPYMAFELYTDVIDGTVVDSAVDSPSYSSAAAGVVDAVSAVPYLDVLTVKKDNEVFMYVVNKHFSNALDADIEFDDLRDFASLEATTLTGTGIDAHTNTGLPQIPGIELAEQRSAGRFEFGGPGEINLSETVEDAAEIAPTGTSLRRSFPPLSITRLRFTRANFGN